jgi:hypothetical protein
MGMGGGGGYEDGGVEYWGRGTWEGEYGDGGEGHGEWESVGSMPKTLHI